MFVISKPCGFIDWLGLIPCMLLPPFVFTIYCIRPPLQYKEPNFLEEDISEEWKMRSCKTSVI